MFSIYSFIITFYSFIFTICLFTFNICLFIFSICLFIFNICLFAFNICLFTFNICLFIFSICLFIFNICLFIFNICVYSVLVFIQAQHLCSFLHLHSTIIFIQNVTYSILDLSIQRFLSIQVIQDLLRISLTHGSSALPAAY